MIGSAVCLSDMLLNQLALHAFMSENLIPGERGLNKRQCKILCLAKEDRIEGGWELR